jgi:protein NEDD1
VLRTRVSTSRENIFDDASDTPMRSNTRVTSSQKSGVLGIHAHPGESISTRLASLRTDKTRETRVASGSSARSEITRTSSNLSAGTKTKGSSLNRAPSTISISSSKTRDSAHSKTPTDDARTDLSSPDFPIDPVTPVSDMKKQPAGITVEAQRPRVRPSAGRPRTETGSTGIGVIGTGKSRGSKNKGKEEVNVNTDDAGKCEELNAVEEDEEEVQIAHERELSMQISPRGSAAHTWVPPPLRRTSGTFPMQSGASGAYELFRGLIADMQAKNHADMKALHVDMLRMGRGLRQEMEEWGGEVKKLREENERLREENDRLRRGY